MKPACILLMIMVSCSQEQVRNMKDLDQSMLDLKIYQENLGEHISNGRLEDGQWLLDGLDSTLNTVAATITEHHRMKRPFSYYKKKLLDPPLDDLHNAFRKNDTSQARKQYILLIDKCNKCHIDLEVDKHVRY